MSRDPPEVARRVPNPGAPVPIELIPGVDDGRGAGLKGPLVRAVHVLHINIETGRHRAVLAGGLSHHDHRVSHSHLDMHDGPVRAFHGRVLLRGAENLPHKTNHLLDSLVDEIGSHVSISFWNSSDHGGPSILAPGTSQADDE